MDLGKLTVKTPLSKDALICSLCMMAIIENMRLRQKGSRSTCLDSFREWNGTGELSKAALANSISAFLVFGRDFGLPGYRKKAVMNLNVHVLFLQSREFECSGDNIRFRILMDVHSVTDVSIGCPETTRASQV